MIALRILLGIAMSGIYPGLTYLISTWYTRREQQLRFALLQSGEVIILATGGIVNYGLNTLEGHALKGWYEFLDVDFMLFSSISSTMFNDLKDFHLPLSGCS